MEVRQQESCMAHPSLLSLTAVMVTPRYFATRSGVAETGNHVRRWRGGGVCAHGAPKMYQPNGANGVQGGGDRR